MIRISSNRFITEEEYNKLMSFTGSTVPSCGSCFIVLPHEILFNNPILNQKLVSVGAWLSINSSTVTYETARIDGSVIDIDRHFISALSGGTASIAGPIKNFPEHHSLRLPYWYCKKEGNKDA